MGTVSLQCCVFLGPRPAAGIDVFYVFIHFAFYFHLFILYYFLFYAFLRLSILLNSAFPCLMRTQVSREYSPPSTARKTTDGS